MHLLLTDRTACARCGPTFGLILLADRLEDRRVCEGVLGCSNCREKYPIRDGIADLRPPPRTPLAPLGPASSGAPAESSGVQPLVAAAASGVGPGGGKLLLCGAASSLAASIAGVVPDGVEVVTAHTERPALPLAPGVSATVVGPMLPFSDATFAGVILLGSDATTETLREVARVLLRGYHAVLLAPPADAQARLGAAGLLRFARGEGVAAAGR